MKKDRKYRKIDQLSKALDAKNIDKVLNYLDKDCIFQAGNQEIIQGKEQIRLLLEGFFKNVNATKHNIKDIFESDTFLVHRGTVTYTRLDHSILSVPFCDVFKMKEEKIIEYTIYIDWSELFN